MKIKVKCLLTMLLIIFIITILLPLTTLAATESVTNVDTKEEFITAINDDTITTINLTADINLTGSGVLDIDNRTINLNGHTITANNFTLIFQGSNFIIQNGIFDSNGGSYALFIGDEGDTNNVIIEKLTLKGGINIYNSSNVTLRDVDITGTNYYAIWCDENGKAIVESGNFKTNGNAVLGLSTDESELKITGGNFITNNKPLVLEGISDGKPYRKPIISGGTFDIPVDEDYRDNGFEVVQNSNGEYILCNHSKVVTKNFKKATCTETGYTGDTYCTKCNKLITNGSEVVALGHHLIHKDAVAETKTKAGIIEHWTCDRCHKNFADETAKKELTTIVGNPPLGNNNNDDNSDQINTEMNIPNPATSDTITIYFTLLSIAIISFIIIRIYKKKLYNQ